MKIQVMDNHKKAGRTFALLAGSVLIAGVLLTSCNQQQKKTDDMQSSADTIKPMVDTAQIAADWEKFKADANEEIRQSKDSIESFKTRIAKADRKMKARYEARVAELDRKNAELEARLQDFKERGKEKWDQFKIDFNRDMDKLKQEIKDSTALNSK
jgi:hypothetical protein